MKVLKSWGADGQVVLSLTADDPQDLKSQEPVFIAFDGLPVPFYFESFQPRGSKRALVRLTGIHSLKDADELAGSAIYADYFEEEGEEDFTGWQVRTPDGVVIGTVTDYEDIPGNLCLWVECPDGRQVLLPFHEDLIVSVNDASLTLTLQLPEGILDL